MGKGVGTTGQIQTPDPQGLLRYLLGGSIQFLLQALAPMLQRTRVVQAQTFNIDHFQPGLADFGSHHRQMRQLAIGEHITIDKIPCTPTNLAAIGVLGSDPVVHHQPAFAHRSGENFAVFAQVGVPDVFKHPDADDFVEPAILRQIAIIEQLQINLVLQTFSVDALTGKFELFLAEGNPEYLDPIFACGKPRQPAPTAAYIQQVFAGLESQLAA